MSAFSLERILVGYRPDGSGDEATALGAALAHATGAELVLASVVPAVWIENPGRRSGDAIVHSGVRDAAASALHDAATALAGAPGAGRVERRLEASPSPAYGLHDLAEELDADLVVLGSTRRGAAGRVVLGTVAERLLHGAPCAVAVTPAGYTAPDGGFEGIGVAFDGSAEAEIALAHAHALAGACGSALHVFLAIEPVPVVLERWVPLPGLEEQVRIERVDATARQDRAARRAIDDAVAALGGDVSVRTHVLETDDVAHELLAAASGEVDLLVCGSRGYGPVRRTLLGSVSTALIRAATMPVLVVPRGDAAQ